MEVQNENKIKHNKWHPSPSDQGPVCFIYQKVKIKINLAHKEEPAYAVYNKCLKITNHLKIARHNDGCRMLQYNAWL